MASKPAQRRKPTQGRAVESHAKIIAGARTLLTSEGFAGFSMRKLAVASGVGLGTIYDYFPSATQIIHVLLIERLELRQDMLKATFADVSREQGLAVFVPSYLKLLIGQGFWSKFDTQLHEAAKSDPELRALFEGQENQIALQYVAEMKRAGSSWSDADLLQVARANMAVSQMIAEQGSGAEHTSGAARDMQITLSANMILANLKMVLRPQNAVSALATQ